MIDFRQVSIFLYNISSIKVRSLAFLRINNSFSWSNLPCCKAYSRAVFGAYGANTILKIKMLNIHLMELIGHFYLILVLFTKPVQIYEVSVYAKYIRIINDDNEYYIFITEFYVF